MGKHKSHQIGRNALAIVRRFFPDVQKVNDADEDVTIEVTKRDVNSSRKKDHAECAMAVACKRFLHLDGVIVSRSKAYLIKGTTATRFVVPGSVTREVVSFDRGGGFEPGTYELTAPPKGKRLGDYPSGNPDKRGTTGRSRHVHMTEGIRTSIGGPGSRL